jgi:hypothetical protein
MSEGARGTALNAHALAAHPGDAKHENRNRAELKRVHVGQRAAMRSETGVSWGPNEQEDDPHQTERAHASAARERFAHRHS